MLSTQEASEIPQEDTTVSQKPSMGQVSPQHGHNGVPFNTKISSQFALAAT